MTEKSKILDLRFIVLPSGVVMEVLYVEGIALNLTPNAVANKSPLSEIYRAWEYTDDFSIYTYRRDLFPELQEELNNFANSNTFFGEKPVPRIERKTDCRDYRVSWRDLNYSLPTDCFHAIETIIGHEIPIYAPKRFESEWRQEFPREFKIEDIPSGQTIPITADLNNTNHFIALGQLPIDDVANWTIKQINQLQQSDIEIHRFSMWEGE